MAMAHAATRRRTVRADGFCVSVFAVDWLEHGKSSREHHGERIVVNHSYAALIGAVVFTWLGMVIAVSFIETPLKFRAPGVTVPIGLAIGRLVFRALNIAEAVLAAGLLVAVLVGRPTVPAATLTVLALVLLTIQLGAIRPRLNRRTDRVLNAPDGLDVPRSRAHFAYIAVEAMKVAVLLALGILTLVT
jgi:hypothetical protein